MRITLLFLLLLTVINGYKIVFFVLDISTSQVIFNKRIAETLADRGHNVTMVLVKALDETRKNEIPIKENINLYIVNGSIGVTREEFENQQKSVMFEDYSLFDRKVWKSAQTGRQFIFGSCRNILSNAEFLTWLKEQHFDLAFLYAFQACPVGLVHIGRIPSWIWLIR
ncbi:unnamed protein product [Cylicocyclus nassatus]|uniref:glucuronosyltransferase n=1 Tax=Cylicocyclus nassatus TaxID=53992 RepID=A0AA36H2E8_CYLNA|nr:unnamed protein product [Cylicocyclus nassatus]